MNKRSWPVWLEALRPDELTRARLRRRILAEAGPILFARHPASWQEVAAGWATLLLPAAAVVTLVFGGLAVQSGPRQEVAALQTEMSGLAGLADLAGATDEPLSDVVLVMSYALLEIPSP